MVCMQEVDFLIVLRQFHFYENDPVSNDGFYVGSVYVNTGQSGYLFK